MWDSNLSLVALWAAISLLVFDKATAAPLQNLTRQTIESEYDFIICGGVAEPS
jgi:hypothetical protein